MSTSMDEVEPVPDGDLQSAAHVKGRFYNPATGTVDYCTVLTYIFFSSLLLI